MTLVLTVPGGVPTQLVSWLDESKTPLRGQVLEFDLPSCVAVAGFTTSDIIAALAAGTSEVCFPPGVYDVTSPINQTLDNQVLNFQPGAVLRFAASGLGTLTLGGVGAQMIGDPVARWDAASSATYVAITLQGAASMCDQIRYELNADTPNMTPMRLAGDWSQVGEQHFAGTDGSFKYGLELSDSDGTAVRTAKGGRMVWLMQSSGVLRNFQALLRYHSTLSQCGPIAMVHGNKQFFQSIVEVDGQHNSLLDPQIKSSQGSSVGILLKDDAEFFNIYDGEISGNFLASSVGIRCGDGSKVVGAPATGQLKCYGTRITNWDLGVLITGSSDAILFDGCAIANNGTAHVRIDSQRGADVWPVSGLAFVGCYSEEAAVPGVPFLHLKSGSLNGGIISGGEIGYTGTAITVDAGMSTNQMEFYGTRYPGAGVSPAVVTPNANSAFYFGPNSLDGGTYSKGASADKAIVALNPVLQGLVVGTKGTGSANNRRVQMLTDIYTANFGNLAAGAILTLDFGYPTCPTITTGALRVTMSAGLGQKSSSGVVFTWWIDASGHIGGTAWNSSGSTVNGVSGGVRFEPVVYG